MSEIQHVPPPSRYIPAREEWLKGWCGPVLVDIDGALVPGALIGPDTRPEAERAGPWTVYPCDDDWPDLHDAYKLARSCPTDSIRLDPRRPEVRDMLARALNLPESHRVGEWAVALCWFAGHAGRAVADVLSTYVPSDMLVGGKPQLYTRRSASTLLSVLVAADGWSISRNGVHVWNRADYIARGPETGLAGKLAADLAALNADCALVTPTGLLLPPLAPGEAPILWSDE